jgi:protein-disulfide isomerase
MSKEAERRTKAQEARERANVAARRERMVRFIGGGVVGALVIGIIAVGYLGSRPADSPNVDGKIPAGLTEDLSWVLNPDTTATAEMVIWEDFQCPGCAAFEAIYDASIKKLAADNIVKVLYRPTAFLDARLPGSHSSRGISAWGCALEYGVGDKFHSTLFAAQPETEGVGWKDTDFHAIGLAAGLDKTLRDEFNNCVNDQRYIKWADDSTALFQDAAVPGTPYVSVNGTEIPDEVLKGGPAEFVKWATATAAA